MRFCSGARRANAPAALLALAFILSLAGCSSGFDQDRGDARRGGSILVGLTDRPDSLDPATATSPEALQALWLAYTPPMTYRHAPGANGTTVVPALADAAPKSVDGDATVTFRFRKGLRYSDGRSLLASDFERAWERALVLNPVVRRQLAGVKGASDYASAPDPRKGITGVSVDERTRTVRIELLAPDPGFSRLLTELWSAPVPSGTETVDRSSSPPAGIGPYSLAAPPRGRAYVLTRRKGFALSGVPAGNVDAITGTVESGVERRTAATLAGRLDATQGEPPTAQLPRIRSEEKARYREFQTLSARYLEFDLARRPFSDGDLRQAVSYALDLRTLTRLDAGFLEPTCNLIPPQVPGYVRLDPCPYGDREGNPDLLRAEQLVTKSPARRARVIVDGGQGPRANALARYGVDTLVKIGMRARLARTARDLRRAQLRFAATTPADPAPAPYFDPIEDSGVRSEAGALERGGTLASTADRWAGLDRTVVAGSIVAPYGVATTGVLLSDRLDAANCLRFSPVYGLDLSSLCLK